jgi:rhodanese-related sulfurtransferase
MDGHDHSCYSVAMSIDIPEISPADSWALLRDEPKSLLVDVRTEAEWAYVGLPDLESLGKSVLRVCWQIFPAMNVNPAFEEQLRAQGAAEDHTLLLLCRSGVRSKKAALLLREKGFADCRNVTDGFEGQLDEAKHRGKGGWKSLGLPWKQG